MFQPIYDYCRGFKARHLVGAAKLLASLKAKENQRAIFGSQYVKGFNPLMPSYILDIYSFNCVLLCSMDFKTIHFIKELRPQSDIAGFSN